MDTIKITIEATIKAPVEKVWDLWTNPVHLLHWNNASDDWLTSYAESDLRVDGRFMSRMESRDGSSGFDFSGRFTAVMPYRRITYLMDDDRAVEITFSSQGDQTRVTETFDAEHENPYELQKEGWQSILNNFKKYAETKGSGELLHFEKSIDADIDRVYQCMLDSSAFKDWTSIFNADSHFEGSWSKGSKIIFLGTDKDGNKGGMVGRIRENIPGKFVSIEYTGIITNGEEKYTGSEVDQWAGGLENYSFSRNEGKTLVRVDVDVNPEFVQYFEETWPGALDRLKEICERTTNYKFKS